MNTHTWVECVFSLLLQTQDFVWQTYCSSSVAKTSPRIGTWNHLCVSFSYVVEMRIKLKTLSLFLDKNPIPQDILLPTDWLISTPLINVAFHCPVLGSTFPQMLQRLAYLINATHNDFQVFTSCYDEPQGVHSDCNTCWLRGTRLNLSPDLVRHSICPLTQWSAWKCCGYMGAWALKQLHQKPVAAVCLHAFVKTLTVLQSNTISGIDYNPSASSLQYSYGQLDKGLVSRSCFITPTNTVYCSVLV